MQYLDLSYKDDFVVVCGDIHGEFETLAFNVARKGIENAIVIVAADSDSINWHTMIICINKNCIGSWKSKMFFCSWYVAIMTPLCSLIKS